MCSYIFSIDILYPITVFEGESGFGEDEKKSAFFLLNLQGITCR